MNPANPLLRPTAILLVMLSHSIGWGIRGNYGHEFGAMMPGALSALAISQFSGREDWRRRAPFFALFGALGWAFGGSMSYMPPLAYTHSGHLPTQLYGFLTVFAIGFLWTSLGAAGTAYAAVETRERLTGFFQPLCWILAAWTLQYWLEPALVRRWIEARAPGAAAGSFRQLSPLYWLDSDWLGVSLALLALCGYDLWSRRFEKFTRLITYAATGAAAGFLVQRLLAAVGWLEPLARAWCDLAFALFTVTTIALLVRHSRKPLAVVPSTWLGKGQLFYLVFLWIIVAGNFTKALVAFHQTRLVTEWLVAVNAMAASYLILAFPPSDCRAPRGLRSYAGIVRKKAGAGLPVVLLLVLSFTAVVRSVYGDRHDGYGNRNLRFGPEAEWKVRPLLLDLPHR